MTHWRDKVCIACKGPLPTPTWSGQRYICCSGNDCGCGGGRLPIEFCSVDCWEDYEEPEPTEPDEPPDPDGECYRGNEAASALAEQQAQAKRLK
jgi:hypothetical protein